MIETTLLRMYSRAMQNMDRKLTEMDRKIDHIIFRLREMDPRIGPGRVEDESDVSEIRDL